MRSSVALGAGFLGATLGLAAGWVLWAERPEGAEEGTAPGAPTTLRDRSGDRRTPDVEIESTVVLRQEIVDLERQLAVANEIARAATLEIEGVPIRWGREVPDEFTAAGFERRLREAIAECGVDIEVVGLDCDEPPCLAVLRPREERWHAKLVNECPAWREVYSNRTINMSASVDCGDGRNDSFLMLGSALAWSHVEDPDGAEEGNHGKRMDLRAGSWKGSWECPPL
jgi:hypothetical protein